MFSKLLVACLLASIFYSKCQVANGVCKLNKHELESDPRVFAIQEYGLWTLLQQDTVATGMRLQVICDAGNIIETVCQPSGEFDKSITLGNCVKPMKAVVEKVPNNYCPYENYRVGYRLANNNFLELYNSCYDTEHIRAKSVKYKMYSTSFTIDRPDSAFTLDVISGAAAKSFKSSSIYERFRQLFGEQQKYIKSSRDLVFNRGHLAPSADFLFLYAKRATFKYINVIPQFSSINRGDWKTMETWVRQHATKFQNGLVIETGVTDEILQLNDQNNNKVDIYLGDGRKNPVPKWIYKIVEDANGRTVFLIYNNIFPANGTDSRPPCRTVPCPITTQSSGLMYCCDPAKGTSRKRKRD